MAYYYGSRFILSAFQICFVVFVSQFLTTSELQLRAFSLIIQAYGNVVAAMRKTRAAPYDRLLTESVCSRQEFQVSSIFDKI